MIARKHPSMKKTLLTGLLLMFLIQLAGAQQPKSGKLRSWSNKKPPITTRILTGADRTEMYVDYLKGKNVAMVLNPTSVIGINLTPSVDSLLKRGVHIVKIF